ncbi:protein kinase [Streptomyces sp. NBC_01221]|uniref:serine/threonine-protein kinase n=2 Tax=unclassified Streptomyces TaxID=2593676 RepID=UPI00224FB117|nr:MULTISPECIES: serine/threonine protein kinase [unclassified Streptomyces]MCX4784875.1 protein kinase [Streptomyces sp. NBC_01221]WSJ40362.1 protein kinase [Streptomyces sp. NBC_01321]WSP53496.1 protein kinase [Streptomyces sp. NBC_01241]WSU25835.1 protein kinase [Streptomyces sp. NBC_01108]
MRRVIDDRFELVSRLSSGGMGTVWRAHDLALHRDVALKEVRPPDPALAENDPESARLLRERALREARALARLDHPGVVTVHHIVDGGDHPYPWIVMEPVPGASLAERLAEGTLTPVEAAELGRGVLSALRAAHAAGILHRDVKPANVLLRADGSPVLTDFGIAAIRESTSLTATGSIIGSPDYMAPERIRGAEGDPSSDLWSLGMMLYVAVEGRHPLRRATTLATLAAVLDEEIPAPLQAGPLAPVLTALLTRDTVARPGPEELDRMLAAVSAPAVTPPGRDPRLPRDAVPPHREPLTLRDAIPSGPTAVLPTAPVRRPAGASGPGSRPVPASPRPEPATLGTQEIRRRIRQGRAVAITTALAGTALTGVLVWSLVPDPDTKTSGSTPSAPARASHGPSAAGNDGAKEANEARTKDLLTPAGARSVIAALKPVMGGTRITSFTLFEEHARVEAPVSTNKNLYDVYAYQDGEATRERAGGTLAPGAKSVDLEKIDWDALPGLIRRADKELGVAEPTGHYVDIDAASPFDDYRPTLSVYVSDEYGGAYLRADINGKVLKKYPRNG